MMHIMVFRHTVMLAASAKSAHNFRCNFRLEKVHM